MQVQITEVSNCASLNITGVYPGIYDETMVNGKRADYIYEPESSVTTTGSAVSSSNSTASSSSSSYGYNVDQSIVLYFQVLLH